MTSIPTISRRALVAGIPLLLAGCGISPEGFDFPSYSGFDDGGNRVPPLDLTVIDRGLLRTVVSWNGPQKPGSIVVNIPERHLYLVAGGGRALRYSVGVGRAEGLNFRGSAIIGRK